MKPDGLTPVALQAKSLLTALIRRLRAYAVFGRTFGAGKWTREGAPAFLQELRLCSPSPFSGYYRPDTNV